MSKIEKSAAVDSAAIKRIRQRNMQKKQRLAIVLTAILLALLIGAAFVVSYLVDIYTFEDKDGTVYYAKRTNGAYALYDADGDMCPKSASGHYETKLGTMVSVNAESGECQVYAYVHTEGTEVRDWGEYVLLYKQLTYDQGSTNDSSRVIKSIEVHNEHGSFTFERDKSMNFVIKGKEGVPYDRERFAYLAVACGYTLSSRRLESPKKLANGDIDYAEYGLAPEKRTREEKDANGSTVTVEYNYEPMWFVITTMSGESHKVIIGDKTVTGTGYYARYDGRDTIYVLGSSGIDEYVSNSIESFVTPTIVYPMTSVDYFNVSNFMIYADIDYESIYSALLEKYGEVVIDKLDEAQREAFEKDYSELFARHSKKLCHFSYLDAVDRRGTLYEHTPFVNALEYAEGYFLNQNSIDTVLSSFYSTDFTGVVRLSPTDEELLEYGLIDPAYVVMFYYETTDSKGESVYAQNFVSISEKSEDGVYYAYSEVYDMITAVSADGFAYLEWEDIMWYETSYIQNDISFVDKIVIESPAFKVDFEIEDSASKYMTYLEGAGSVIKGTDYKVAKDPATGKYVLYKGENAVDAVYRGDYLIMPTVYTTGKAEAENYLFAEYAEFDLDGDGENDGVTYYFYNIGYNKERGGYALYAQVVYADFEGNRLTDDTLVWGQVAISTEFFATNNGYIFFTSSSSQAGARLDAVYGANKRGAWGRGNIFITSSDKYVIVDEKTGEWMTVKDYAQGIYFADSVTSRLAERAVTIPALYDSTGKLTRYEETYYPTTDKKLQYNEETGKIMAYNKLKGVYENITYSDCSIGVWASGAYYRIDGGKLVVVNEVTGEWGYVSVLSTPSYIANVYANGALLDYSLPSLTATGKSTETTAMENFQEFYKALLMASFEGMADLDEAEMQRLSALDDFSGEGSDNPCQLKITIVTKDHAGNERNVVYRIYRYSERRAYITVEVVDKDGQSSPSDAYGAFCVLQSFAEKIIEDAERIVNGVLVDATSKY